MGKIHIIRIPEGAEVQYTIQVVEGEGDSVVILGPDDEPYPGTVLVEEDPDAQPKTVRYRLVRPAYSRASPFVGARIYKLNPERTIIDALEEVEDEDGVANSAWLKVHHPYLESGANPTFVYIARKYKGTIYAEKV